ncbi:helix-turn-helix domain-containing protein [Comamonas guangdongensis]|uniref:Helix-turn-helix domain-containing protein n=1 Tax=Comamonas guangdongensis TaxID=510515 RepID=A0ABV3ZXH7_9BURK
MQYEGEDIFVINERLKIERERLGLTQPVFAEIAGASKRTLIDWEKGVSSPTAVQLSALASAGVDVLFVVTGQRSQAVPVQASLPKEHQALLNSYEMCSAAARKNLLQSAALLAAGMPSTGGGGVHVRGSGNVTAGRDVNGSEKTKAGSRQR